MRFRSLAALSVLVAGGCTPPEPHPPTPAAPSAPPNSTAAAPAAETTTTTTTPATPSPAALLDRVRPDFERCYSDGKSEAPMLDGRITFHAAAGADGKIGCVIPSDDSGLTQRVEDCMSDRLARESYGANASVVDVRVVVRGGVLALEHGAGTSTALETVETVRMPDAFEVLESLLPRFEDCVSGTSGQATMLAGARVGATGAVECALATASGPVTPRASTCAAAVLREARFPPPKRAPGIILVPIAVH